MARMKYVQRRANRFEFRYQMPDDIAGKAYPTPWPEALSWCVNARTGRFKTELIRSLKSNDSRSAERAALPLIEEAHRLVDLSRKALIDGPPTSIASDTVNNLAKEYEVGILRRDQALRATGLGLDIQSGQVRPDGEGMSDDDLQLYTKAVAHLDHLARSEAARMRGGESLHLNLNRALQEKGIVLHPDDPAWRQLELGFIKAQQSALTGVTARLRGEAIPTPILALSSSVLLSKAVQNWAEGGGRAVRKPRENSIAEAKRAVQRFIELHGDLDIHTITKAHARDYRDTLAKIPKRLPHALAKLRLPQLMQRDLSKYEPRNAQTINKSLNLIAGILAKSERDGHFETLAGWSNPFHVGFDISKMEREPYEPFSIDELNALFASPVYSEGARPIGGRGEAAFWFPLIALFSGARRTEIAQLKVGDIQIASGIWFIDFNDKGADQNLKNVSSARSVPIHYELINMGLVRHATKRSQESSSSGPLWSGFEPPIEPKAKMWSKWFGRYLGIHAVDHPSKTFHSFRHTFKRACREAGISEEIHHAFTGHAGGGVGRSYGRARRSDGTMDRGVSLERLKLEIDRLSYPNLAISSESQME